MNANSALILGLNERPILLEHRNDLHPEVRTLDRHGLVHAVSFSTGSIVSANRTTPLLRNYVSEAVKSNLEGQPLAIFGENVIGIIRVPKVRLAGHALNNAKAVNGCLCSSTAKDPPPSRDRLRKFPSVWLYFSQNFGDSRSGDTPDEIEAVHRLANHQITIGLPGRKSLTIDRRSN